MKCPICNGTGIEKIYDKRTNAYLHIPCATCHETGYINETSHSNQTNEEWFNGLSIAEKAKWLSRHSQFMYNCGEKQTIPKTMFEEDWEFWLKSMHEV